MKLIGFITLLWITASSINAQELQQVSSKNAEFAFDLYGRLETKNKNVFLSPYSISSALAMTYAGAKNETASQMAKVMRFGSDQTVFHKSFENLMANIAGKNGKDLELNIANRLFGDLRFKFLPSFLKLVEDKYNAPLEKVDFVKDLEGSRKRINSWVEEKTKDKIKNLLKKGVLPDSTKLVLVNAIYFYGDWAYQFDSMVTQKQKFHVNGTDAQPTDMMGQQHYFAYYETKDMQAIRMPYKGHKMSMEIFLPTKNDGLSEMMEGLDAKTYQKWSSAMQGQEVYVQMPKFKMTTDFKLGDKLKDMGMGLAFSNSADFSGMTGKPDLKISKVIHKAFIDVSEKGTEAAAATAVVMAVVTSVAPDPKPIKVFRADHPFFFVIKDNENGSILFMGQVNDPR